MGKVMDKSFVGLAASVRGTKRVSAATVSVSSKTWGYTKSKKNGLVSRYEAKKAELIREKQVALMVAVYSSTQVAYLDKEDQRMVAKYKALHLKSISSEFPAEKKTFEDKALQLFLSLLDEETLASVSSL